MILCIRLILTLLTRVSVIVTGLMNLAGGFVYEFPISLDSYRAPVGSVSPAIIADDIIPLVASDTVPVLPLPELSDASPLTFDREAGFYDAPFVLRISPGKPEYEIIYTIDCTNPQTSTTAIRSSSAVTLTIDPDMGNGRPLTPVFIVRASQVAEGFSPSKPVTYSFIFADKVLLQQHPGGDWPQASVNGQVIDLEMDPAIVNDPRYARHMTASLKDIPSLSLVTETSDMFGQSQGIYVNPYGRGRDWERQCSLELINGDNSVGFRVNAGVRIRGGTSRNPGNPKHSFRFIFRKEYGAGKLRYPLFGDEGPDKFDKIDLRTEQNYSWSMDGDSHNTFLRDIFSRDTQRDMGQPYTRGRYYHLYLNGMYWGLYQTQERADSDYAATYFGYSEDDYDVIKVSTEAWPYVNEATDGTMVSWQELWNRSVRGFVSNADYFALEGRDQDGKPVKGKRVWVDIDNLIDYMLVIFYTGNFDGPVSAFGGNSMANNYYAIFSRKNMGQGYIFLAHDSEHSMFVSPYSLSRGIHENRVVIDNPPTTATGTDNFQPQWLHHKLVSNAEYRLRFADRVHKHFSLGGALSPGKCVNRFNTRKDQIDMAIIAESARWGDARNPRARNKLDDWLPEVTDILNNFFPARSEIVLGQLRDAGLFPSIEPPVVRESGLTLYEGRVVSKPVTITLINPNHAGHIYYTTDGSDPRLLRGVISSKAVQAVNGTNLSITGSTILKARILHGQIWSALKEVRFIAENEDYSNLKVTELHYHPPDLTGEAGTVKGKDLEFLELKNTGNGALNISGVTIAEAVNYTVPEGVVLPPKGFWVVASEPGEFYSYYGMNPDGGFNGSFSNSGEYVAIKGKNGNLILSFTYSNDLPWPPEAGGKGYSLVSREGDPGGSPDLADYWRHSMNKGGSPFANDPVSTSAKEYRQGENEWIHLYPNPSGGRLTVHLSEEITDPVKIDFVSQTGITVLTITTEGTTVIELTEAMLAQGIYNVIARHRERLFVTKLVYINE